MKTNMRILVLIYSLFALTMITGCEKGFDEINSDPNLVVNVPADNLLPGIILSISNAENGFMESFAYASAWVQHTSCALWPDPDRYNFERSRNLMWDQLYTGPLMDLKTMNTKALEDNNQGLRAISLIMSGYAFALLTDSYGPVPFTEALSLENGINKPSYDPEEDIIHALIDSLKVANELLTGLPSVDIRDGYDVLFDGDAMKWRKFGNALRFRLLMRISIKDESFAAPIIDELVSNPDSPLPENTSDNIMFVYPGTSPTNYHPLYDVLSEEASDGGYRISSTLMDQMILTSDPRLPVYAMENEDGEYAGLPNGTVTGSSLLDKYSRINTSYGKKDRAGIFITYSEVAFLLAEAAERGFIDENPGTYYNEAIRANFHDCGISESKLNTFIANPLVAYTGLESLYMQKWVSLFGRGMEAWAEYRRTGIPGLSPANGAFINSIPNRFLYPLSEEQSNWDALQEAIKMLSDGDALTSKIWWIQ